MLQFNPPLGSAIHIHSRATLIFTLLGSLDDHITAQVWSNVSGEWRAIDFTDPLQENQPTPQPHLNLVPALLHQRLPAKLYQARFSPNSSLPSGSFGYTFRLYDKRDGSLCWLGDQHNNGRLIVEPCSDECFACLDGAQACAWRSTRADAGASHEVARFAAPHVAHGWAITIESKPLRLPLHLHDAPSGWALAESGDQVLDRTSLSPDEMQCCFVALFSAGQDSPSLCFAGEALSLKASGDTPLRICAQGKVQHVHSSSGNRHVLQDSVLLAVADGLVALETDSESFITFYHPSTSTVHVLPTVAYPPALSVIHLRNFQAVLEPRMETAWFCLLSTSSSEAIFHSESSVSLLVPSEGGAFTVSPATQTVNGHFAAVLDPVGSSPVVRDVSAPGILMTVSSRDDLFSRATLFTLVWFILGTLFRVLERIGPLRRAAALVDVAALVEVFHQSGSPLRAFTERFVNGHAPSPSTTTVTTPEEAASAAEETASFAIPVKQGEAVTANVLLACKDPGSRSATRSNPAPATFFIGDQAVEENVVTEHGELGPSPTSVQLPLPTHQKPTTTAILRIVF
ncbi:hypothetical protein BKA62DRAFT_497377 [Auriculariales sp. MPI-PUGE-AT-0066]|nr:hypothetical protein BKA62DRAFT_497377 [Auriculariales sp. MPI-PUGE-AT-0066]